MSRTRIILAQELWGVPHDARQDIAKDIAALTNLVVGSRDVQVEFLHAAPWIFQFHENNGKMESLKGSTIVSEMICIEETTGRALHAFANAVVCIFWEHLIREFPADNIRMPNCWARQYGTDVTGWAEGRPSTNKVPGVIAVLTRVAAGTSNSRALAQLYTLFPAPPDPD